MPAPEFVWVSADPADPDDLMTCRLAPGYLCVAECMDDAAWYCSVSRGGVDVIHSTDADVLPLTAKAARRLCELAVLADLYRRSGG